MDINSETWLAIKAVTEGTYHVLLIDGYVTSLFRLLGLAHHTRT